MTNISFCTAVHYHNPSFWQNMMEITDEYFYFGDKKVQVISGLNRDGAESVVWIDAPCKYTACKVASWCIPIIPLFFLITKIVFRLQHKFVLIDTNEMATVISKNYRRHVAQKTFSQKKAATVISKYYQRYVAKKELAATTIQRIFRGYSDRKKVKQMRESEPLAASYAKLRANTKSISDGYGEFLVYRQNSKDPIAEDLFTEAYKIIHNPDAHKVPDRLTYVREQLKTVDPELDVIFIPRTLYELIYIRAAIEEEMNNKTICGAQDEHQYDYLIKHINSSEKEYLTKCWHICRFTDNPPTQEDIQRLYHLAFRMNMLALEKLPKAIPEELRGEEITEWTEQELQFLKKHRKEFPQLFRDGKISGNCGAKGGAINFGYNPSMGRIVCLEMGIRNSTDAQVVRNAVALECDEVAKNAFILYRAQEFELIEPLDPESVTLSYGTSLFAGAFLDGTATVFHYTIQNLRDTIAIVVPKREEHPFYIPTSSPIQQLLSVGEYFHPRSLLIKSDEPRDVVNGIFLSYQNPPPESLYSSQDKDTLANKLLEYHNQAFRLTKRDLSAEREKKREEEKGACTIM